MQNPNQPPLWRQLQQVAQMLAAIEAGRSATSVLEEVDAASRPGVQALVFEVLRNWGRAQALGQLLVQRTPPAASRTLLCVALGLISRDDASYTPYTLVDQTVEAAKRNKATSSQAAFINACLRRFLRQQQMLIAQTQQQAQAQWNHPTWWIEQVRIDHPQHWQAILQANCSKAPMVLRVNARKVTQAEYLQALTAINMEAWSVGAHGIALAQPCAVGLLPGFKEGWVSVQDAAAQQAAPLLLGGVSTKTPRVLDACAAPGGKTAHLLELADAQVTALDIDPERCQKISSNLQRLGLRARVIAADATEPHASWASEPYDAILLDAPCTASGIVRRHPDVPWLRRPTDIVQLASTQARLLATLWPLLKPGGRLLYATCSVFRAEGDEQIQAFLVRHPGAALRSSLALLPGEHDGFYYALLEKQV